MILTALQPHVVQRIMLLVVKWNIKRIPGVITAVTSPPAVEKDIFTISCLFDEPRKGGNTIPWTFN